MTSLRPSPTLLSASALLGATFAPEFIHRIVANIANHVPAILGLEKCLLTHGRRVKTVIGVYVALATVRWFNQGLSVLAHNSWRWTRAPGWDWPNEIAVITGGVSGIGKSAVEKLVAKGLRVVVLDIQDAPDSFDNHPRIHFYKCDVSDPKAVAAVAEAVRQDVGHPSILINNAGILRRGPILENTDENLQLTFGVNTMAHWYTARAFVPNMVDQDKGHVVTVASNASFMSLSKSSDYSASKAAVQAFHEALGAELRNYHCAPNVLTTAVHTHYVRTPILKDHLGSLDRQGATVLEPDFVAERIVDRLMSRRGGQLILPESHASVSGIRAWPAWCHAFVVDSLASKSAKRSPRKE